MKALALGLALLPQITPQFKSAAIRATWLKKVSDYHASHDVSRVNCPMILTQPRVKAAVVDKPNNSVALDGAGKALPLLRWAGSKKRQFTRLQSFFPKSFGSYIEPFAGSAAFFFRLGPASARLNDLNSDVTEFYQHAAASPQHFFAEFDELLRTKHNYYVARNRFNALNCCREKSVLFYFLNRNCFNGIYRTNKHGAFNVPFSSSRVSPYLTYEQFTSSTRLLARAAVFNEDFESFCEKNVGRNDFVYLDPPYYEQGKRVFNEYSSTPFSPDDFDRLVSLLSAIDSAGAKFLLTFPLTKQTRRLARDWSSSRHQVFRSVAGDASKRTVQTEMLIYNYAP